MKRLWKIFLMCSIAFGMVGCTFSNMVDDGQNNETVIEPSSSEKETEQETQKREVVIVENEEMDIIIIEYDETTIHFHVVNKKETNLIMKFDTVLVKGIENGKNISVEYDIADNFHIASQMEQNEELVLGSEMTTVETIELVLKVYEEGSEEKVLFEKMVRLGL